MNTSTIENINKEIEKNLGHQHLDDIMVIASPFTGSSKVVYILTPTAIPMATLQQWSAHYRCNIVEVSGFDWDNDMTPWSATNVPATEPPFAGHAASFLHLLTDHIVPEAEHAMGLSTDTERTLLGISLSGLFAVWSWMTDDCFTNIGSISGSFWFDNFIDWLQRHVIHKSGMARFSIGALEGGSHGNPRFANVQEQTREGVDILIKAGIDATFTTNPGDYFAPIAPRIDSMLSLLFPNAGK